LDKKTDRSELDERKRKTDQSLMKENGDKAKIYAELHLYKDIGKIV